MDMNHPKSAWVLLFLKPFIHRYLHSFLFRTSRTSTFALRELQIKNPYSLRIFDYAVNSRSVRGIGGLQSILFTDLFLLGSTDL